MLIWFKVFLLLHNTTYNDNLYLCFYNFFFWWYESEGVCLLKIQFLSFQILAVLIHQLWNKTRKTVFLVYTIRSSYYQGHLGKCFWDSVCNFWNSGELRIHYFAHITNLSFTGLKNFDISLNLHDILGVEHAIISRNQTWKAE